LRRKRVNWNKTVVYFPRAIANVNREVKREKRRNDTKKRERGRERERKRKWGK
jgi:hypothetical protein